MISKGASLLRRACIVVLLLSLAGCGSSSNPSPTSPTSTISALTISGTTLIAGIGQTTQLTATATLTNGTTQNVTAQATWSSSNAAVATVSAAGLVTAHALGAVTISAVNQGVTGTTVISVSNPGTPTTSNHGTISAVINGVPWTGSAVSVIFDASRTILAVGASDGPRTLAFAVGSGSALATGTFPLNITTPSNASLIIGSNIWRAGGGSATGTGTITLATLTAVGTTGTFSFSLAPAVGTNTTGTQVVTDGVFSLTF